MPPKKWEDEEESDAASSSEESSEPKVGAVRRNKFDDEEGEDSDVLDSWDAAEDSEVEREKAKKAAEVKAKAEAEAKAKKKSYKQRLQEHIEERQRLKEEGGFEDSEDSEDEKTKRERLRRTEQESDLKHAVDLFGGDVGGVPSGRKATTGSVVPIDPKDPTVTIDLATIPLLNPNTKLQFEKMRDALVPIIGNNSKKAHYTLFLTEFAKQLAKDLPSDQIKKVASTLTALSNEKLKEEKAAEKGGKKSKAAKSKTTLSVGRTQTADTNAYDNDDFGDDDFM